MAKREMTRNLSTPATSIPDKLYFRIGEAARLCGVETYVLRFWETEFTQLRPNKGGTGQRLYRRSDLELALRIKQLLHHEGYTIAGARQHLAQQGRELRSKNAQSPLPIVSGQAKNTRQSAAIEARLVKLRSEMKELLAVLSVEPQAMPVASRRSAPQHPRSAGPMLFE